MTCLLTDKDWKTRRAISKLFGELPSDAIDSKLVDSLITSLQSDADWNVRKESAISLVKMGTNNSKIVDALIVSLQSDKDWYVRVAAAYSLVQFSIEFSLAPNLIDSFVQCLQHEDDGYVRTAAAEGLGELIKVKESSGRATTDPKVGTSLVRSLKLDSEKDVRKASVISLVKLQLKETPVIDGLIYALQYDDSEHVRAVAVESLLELVEVKQDNVVDALKQALRSDKDKEVKKACLEGIIKYKITDQETMKLLIKTLETSNELRSKIAEYFCSIKDFISSQSELNTSIVEISKKLMEETTTDKETRSFLQKFIQS